MSTTRKIEYLAEAVTALKAEFLNKYVTVSNPTEDEDGNPVGAGGVVVDVFLVSDVIHFELDYGMSVAVEHGAKVEVE